MLTIVCSSKNPNSNFEKHVIKTCGLKNIQFLHYQNNGDYSLTQLYNKGLNDAKYEIVVFMHDDIEINTQNWGYKLLKHFKNEPDYGILGIAGTKELSKSGTWWENRNKMYGIVNHRNVEKNLVWTSEFSKDFKDEIYDTVVVDGVFFAVNKSNIKVKFDENFEGFHFYDISFCFDNFMENVPIGVISNIRITHNSVGATNEKWEENRQKFVEKNKLDLPQSIETYVDYSSYKQNLKKEPKLAIIIPTKEHLDLLYNCVDSIIRKTYYKNFVIYIADTGSSEKSIKEIEENILALDEKRIRLIKYNYYNFAKINNDVVKRHVDLDTDLILFCNNDIVLLNDCISIMVNQYIKNPNTIGTIGARLHYENGFIQHLGIAAFQHENGNLSLTHSGLHQDFLNAGIKESVVKTYGNTAGFMLISKDLFEKYGLFNENYNLCFEDVELNFKALLDNKENICCVNAVAYHYESQSRKPGNTMEDWQLICDFVRKTRMKELIKTVK